MDHDTARQRMVEKLNSGMTGSQDAPILTFHALQAERQADAIKVIQVSLDRIGDVLLQLLEELVQQRAPLALPMPEPPPALKSKPKRKGA